jgi:hypothetical protein
LPRRLAKRLSQRTKALANFPDYLHGWYVAAVQLGRRAVHVNDGVGPRAVPDGRRPLDEVVSDRDHKVCFLEDAE